MYAARGLNRRHFLASTFALGVSGLLPAVASVTKTKQLAKPGAMAFLPLGAIQPTGWLRRQLEIQAAGLSGHLGEVWPDVGPESGWLGGAGEGWERGPYYLDGLVPLAYLLDDKGLKAKVQPWMDWTLGSQRRDGNFGSVRKGNDWWPRMVMLKALLQYEEATADPRVIPFLKRYFAYQLAALAGQPLTNWAKVRWQDNVLSVMWLYDRTGDPDLLELARMLHAQGHDWRAEFEDFKHVKKTTPDDLKKISGEKSQNYHETHGVDVAMGLKSAAVWSRISGDPADRDATAKMLAVLDRYHGQPNGMYSADEHLAGLNPTQGTELCTVVEVMYSLEQALAISGDGSLGDRLEQISYNALPGGISDDMWSHQYDQECNQIQCGDHIKPWVNNGVQGNQFGLAPNFGCCAANYHQGWPKLTSSLWMRTAEGGLAAAVYAPSVVKTRIGKTAVQVEMVTEYPFRKTVEIHLRPEATVSFPLKLRMPQGEGAVVRVNGATVAVTPEKGFATITRSWVAGDVVTLTFAMEPHMVAGFGDSVSVKRGPLVFSLPMEEKWSKVKDHGAAADWRVTAESAWNYGLFSMAQMQVTEHPVGDIPFGKSSPPVTLTTTAALLPEWGSSDGVTHDFPAVRSVAPGQTKTVTLVPYASTKLRITAFPRLEGKSS